MSKNKDNIEKILLTADEVSQWIGFSRAWVYANAGKTFPASRKFGGATRWFKSHIEEWLKEKEDEGFA